MSRIRTLSLLSFVGAVAAICLACDGTDSVLRPADLLREPGFGVHVGGKTSSIVNANACTRAEDDDDVNGKRCKDKKKDFTVTIPIAGVPTPITFQIPDGCEDDSTSYLDTCPARIDYTVTGSTGTNGKKNDLTPCPLWTSGPCESGNEAKVKDLVNGQHSLLGSFIAHLAAIIAAIGDAAVYEPCVQLEATQQKFCPGDETDEANAEKYQELKTNGLYCIFVQ